MDDLLNKKSLILNLKREMKLYYEYKLKHDDSEIKKQLIDSQKSVNKLLYKCADQLDLPILDKLRFLQLDRHDQKAQYLLQYLSHKTQNVKSVIDLQEKVRQDMGRTLAKKTSTSVSNKSAFMGRASNDIQAIQQKMAQKNLPDNVKEQISKQLRRMGGEIQQSIALRYAETLIQIPWNQSTTEVKDIKFAEKILNEDHVGLKEVKERILQFLAVKFRNGNSKGNVICLYGPPGVGKTSIVKSIAKALGRSYTRISLGGMSDQAQLRGHRRTYVAAMPGMIVRALINAKSNNPVILLDEIQKIGKSYKGDPEHALLQILDPSQNSSFTDHYVSIPIDLSKVMFICTANSLQMSHPLLNRLELINVPGYNRKQKLQILQNHLMPNVFKQNAVQGLINFDKEALEQIVKYSNQLGVRQLERHLNKICRKVAFSGEKQQVTVTKVSQILGKRHENKLWAGIGIVNGMAWTPNGGKILIVQAVVYPSQKPKIQVTGQLGDVMKESIKIALSWIRTHSHYFGKYLRTERIDQLERNALHLHFPQGSIKKDGPSAGVTIVTCLVSILIGIPVRANLSMTGEITLSGRVLPVGGIKEKCTSAIYEGMHHIIVPEDNREDYDKIDAELRTKTTVYFVKHVREVLEVAFPELRDFNYSAKI